MTARGDSLDAKALRLIAERRVAVVLVDGERVEARVQGTDSEHVTGYERGGWFCDCQAHRFGQRCSHLAAVQLVCRRPVRERAGLTARRLLEEQREASRVRAGARRDA